MTKHYESTSVRPLQSEEPEPEPPPEPIPGPPPEPIPGPPPVRPPDKTTDEPAFLDAPTLEGMEP